MEFYNTNVARYLLDVPIEPLLNRIGREIDDKGLHGAIEKEDLRALIMKTIPNLRWEIPKTRNYPSISLTESHEIIQEFINQNYLTMSEYNSNPLKNLYFELTSIGKQMSRNG